MPTGSRERKNFLLKWGEYSNAIEFPNKQDKDLEYPLMIEVRVTRSSKCIEETTRDFSENPYVFIVGCPRSGTTLLKCMVDAHPQIAIPREIGRNRSGYFWRKLQDWE